MNNYILLKDKELNDCRLNFISRSKLNGKFIYEILVNKIKKEDILRKKKTIIKWWFYWILVGSKIRYTIFT